MDHEIILGNPIIATNEKLKDLNESKKQIPCPIYKVNVIDICSFDDSLEEDDEIVCAITIDAVDEPNDCFVTKRITEKILRYSTQRSTNEII